MSVSVPSALLILAFVLPEPYSWGIIKSAGWIIDLFHIENETYHNLTVTVFGRLTPNYAPIQILILFILLFALTFIGLVLYGSSSNKNKTPNQALKQGPRGPRSAP